MEKILSNNEIKWISDEKWLELIRENNIKRLKAQGIEPTEENLKALEEQDYENVIPLIEEADKKIAERRKDINSRTVGATVFDTVEEAEEYINYRRIRGKKLYELDKIYNHTSLGEIPGDVISGVWEKLYSDKRMTNEEFELIHKMYLLGRTEGIRSERARRKAKTN